MADSGSGVLRDLKLDRPLGLLLDDDRASPHPAAGGHVFATAQLAVDCEVEQRQVAHTFFQFEPSADRPDLLHFERWFLTSELAAGDAAGPSVGAERRFGDDVECHDGEPSAHPPAQCRAGRAE